ncbi:MAG: ABC transporter permease [Geminicoccaceae bacterium]
MASTGRTVQTTVEIDEVTKQRGRGPIQKLFGSQPFWVVLALVAICLVMSWLQPESFPTADNFFNITRNFAFIGIMALGMTCVILTGGIDLSVGSLMGLVGVVIGLVLQNGVLPLPSPITAWGAIAWVVSIALAVAAFGFFDRSWSRRGGIVAAISTLIICVGIGGLVVGGDDALYIPLPVGTIWIVAIIAGLFVGAYAGAVNGVFVAYVGLPPFVVTLGMLSIARSLAIVLSQNKMIYDFGPDADTFFVLGGGDVFGIANPVWVLVIFTLLFAWIFNFTSWGRYLFAIGGNEQAAGLTGVPVDRIKTEAYIVSGVMASIATVLTVSWAGSAINALGQGYELRVIASTVIGGANLMGGEGSAFGAFVGAALIEVIRNSLLMAGVDANWQGTFVGCFIILAVLLQRVRGRSRD